MGVREAEVPRRGRRSALTVKAAERGLPTNPVWLGQSRIGSENSVLDRDAPRLAERLRMLARNGSLRVRFAAAIVTLPIRPPPKSRSPCGAPFPYEKVIGARRAIRYSLL